MKRRPLLLILLIGVLTPLASTLLFYFAPPQQHTARGEILAPQKTPPQWNLAGGKWTLLYAGDNPCGKACRQRLCQMRQLRLMLPGHYFRLQRAWLQKQQSPPLSLVTSGDCGEARAAAFADTAQQVNVTDGVLAVAGDNGTLPAPASGLKRADYLYLIDPDGNTAMRFAPNLDIYAIRKDLAKLLKLSKGRRQVK